MAYLLKYYTFSAKIRTLIDFNSRITSQQAPSNAEIITTLKYFTQTLIGFAKDVSPNNGHLFLRFVNDTQRTNLFPNLNYSGLFYGIVKLLDVFPLLQSGQIAIGESILDCLKALYFFLDRDSVDQLPYLIASQMEQFPQELHKKIVNLLADTVLPYSLSEDCSADLSIPIVLMLVLQQHSDPSLHTRIMESLLAHKRNLYNDVIAIVAKGTSESRISAANLLFHYWPLINPNIIHRKHIQYRIHAWSAQPCQSLNCNEKGPSVKKLFDPALCAKLGDTIPPMSVCKSCADNIETEEPFLFVCQPMPTANTTVCQNKACESSHRFAVGTCFAEDCIRAHQHVPLRLCQECMTALHANPGAEMHIRHCGMTCAWGTPVERDMIEAIVKLLKETSGQLQEGTEGEIKRPKWLRQLEAGQSLGRDIDSMSDERRMCSRYGIWLMAALCPPSTDAPDSAIGYIMSMLFQWFAATALLPNDSMGAQLEQLKTDFASDWVNTALMNHYEVFVAILMPETPEYAQVGGVWDKLCSKKEQLKEGLSKLLSLMPYDVIQLNTWSRIISQWLAEISHHHDEEDYSELKVLLCKIFEPTMCPLPFEQRKVFDFIFTRMSSGSHSDVLDALDWLHLLCRMDIRIDIPMLMEMLTLCLNRIDDLVKPNNEEDDLKEDIGPLAIQLVSVDIIAQQMKLNEITMPEMSSYTNQLFIVMSLILQYPEDDSKLDAHTCQNPETDNSDCIRCQQASFLYQIIMKLTEQLCPREQIKIEFDNYNHSDWLAEAQLTDSVTTPSHVSNLTSPRNPSIMANSATSPLFSIDPQQSQQQFLQDPKTGNLRFLTATQQEEQSNDEFVGILPSEIVEPVTAQQVTLTEKDVGLETSCQITTAALIDSLKNTQLQMRPNIKTEFWDTSVGRFRFRIDQLPAELQFVYAILMNVDREKDPDVQYFLLHILKYLCLHCEALSNARHENRGFLIWAQENLLIPKLWGLLKSHYAQVGQLAVPLMIHAITLPCGEEVFWNTINRDFTSEQWETRFKAVERVYVLAHLILAQPVKANKLLQTCLSCAFSHLIVSVNDPNSAVSQRAILALQAIPSASLNIICFCLESQFDSCILDRPLIISRIILLTTIVPEESVFSYDFFIQRFETLAIEAQLKCQQGEHGFAPVNKMSFMFYAAYFTPAGEALSNDNYKQCPNVFVLTSADPMSELYQRKVTKARQSLNEASSVRSIVRSLRDNSLKHQLTINTKMEKEESRQAQATAKLRGRRNATCGAELARMKLRKVLMMVRVVSAFSSIKSKLRALTPINVIRSRTASPDLHSAEMTGDKFADHMSPSIHSVFQFDGLTSDAQNPMTSSTNQQSTQYGRLREFTDEESNLCLLLNRVVDMENPERHTIYLTVALFVHFLCNKRSSTTDEKASAKKQSVLLRHFNTLLGYSSSDRCFTVTPHRLRRAAVCNAFMSGLPEVLDTNLLIGNQMLPIIVQLLLHLPSPQKFASDQSSADYSLSLLSLTLRHSWLNTLLPILYKYRFETPPLSEMITKLILIVISTIECHVHVNVCTASETHQPEFFAWSDSSGESGTEEKVIREEEDDQVTTPQHTAEAPEKSSVLRPESLKVKRAASGSHLISFVTETRTIQPSTTQPSIVEPTSSETDRPTISSGKLIGSSRRKQRSKVKKRKKLVRAECIRLTCSFCNESVTTFDEETISMCLIVLSTFLHRESALCAPVLFRILRTVANYITYPVYSWSDIFVPGNSQSVAKQLMRVIFHQLSGSGIALQLFDSKIENPVVFWQTINTSLLDFNELNPVSLIQSLLDDLAENWTLRLGRILHNLSAYIQHVPLDLNVSNWSTVVGQFEAFFRRYYTQLSSENNASNNARKPITTELKSSILIMSSVLRVQNFSTFKNSVSMVEAYSKWLTEALHECKAELRDLLSICSICNRALHRERDKQCITRAIVSELIYAVKFRCELAEPNYLIIIQLVLQDFGEDISEDITDIDQFNTGASEAVRPFLSDVLEFISDLHVLSKLKKQTNSDRMGGDLKAGLAQILALEMSRPALRDNRTIQRFLPWLLTPPNLTQAVPGAFAESVTNVRILSWLLLGALHSSQDCFPVPINCSNYMADYIHFVLAGFADQSKQSVVHMSALFHAFHLCQLWTVYCEKAVAFNEDTFSKAAENIIDFWARVTPAILQLLAHSKVLADMVNLHVANMIQALQQCNSATLCQLYPMWQPILTVYHAQVPSQLRIKLDACENQPQIDAQPLKPWLKKVRFKISQIELQTSAASPFYNV